MFWEGIGLGKLFDSNLASMYIIHAQLQIGLRMNQCNYACVESLCGEKPTITWNKTQCSIGIQDDATVYTALMPHMTSLEGCF